MSIKKILDGIYVPTVQEVLEEFLRKKSGPAVNIDDILKGKTFHSVEEKDGKRIGGAVALQKALDFAGSDGYVATMPELIAAKVKADKSHDFWQKGYTTHTEENIGIDKKGRFYSRDNPVLVVVNGGGILTPERIMQAYDEGLINGGVRYRDEEFDILLDGKPNGNSFVCLVIIMFPKGN